MRYTKLRWLVLLLAFTRRGHAQTCAVNPSESWSTIQGIIAGCPSGSTVTFAAGTYTGVNSSVTVPCGVSLAGPTVNYSQTHYQTAILQESGGITQPIRTTAGCTQSQSISYLEWNGEQSSGGGGFIYVTPGTQNLTINNNYIHGMTGGSYPGCCNEVGIMFAGNASSPLTQNDTVIFNEFGPETPGQDCGTAMTDTKTNNGGGFCAGWASEGQLKNVTITNNIYHNLEQGMKVAEACTSTSTPHCPGGENATNGNTQNLIVSYNWFYYIQRIPFETQSNSDDTTHPTSQYIQYNSFQNRNGNNTTGIGTGQQNFDLSIANGCGNPPSGDDCPSHVDYNVNVQNIGNTKVGAGYEHWGSSSTTGNNNLTEFNYQNAGGAFIWNPSGAFTYNNNVFNINTTASTSTNCVTGTNSFWNHANSPASTPSCSGNSLSNVGSGTYSSVAPGISPASGTYSSGQVVTISNPYTNLRDLNTSAWCTTDGSTPVPGTNGTIMTSYTLTSSVTFNCVGMWGSINQPYSYPSGYGYVPSAVVARSYSVGTPAATPVLTPASELFSSPITVTITTTTPSATIYYTTDGSIPTTSSPVYSAPIVVSVTTTINAIATATGYTTSAVGSGTYTYASASSPTIVSGTVSLSGTAQTQ